MEPIVFELDKTGNFNGTTTIVADRDDFTVTGQRYYQLPITGAAGLIEADIFGLFQATALKLVGLSGVSYNPLSTAEVVTPFSAVRSTVQLSPEIQYMVMFPGDRLRLTTAETTASTQVVLVVNELSEANHVRFAARASFRPPSVAGAATRRRFQIYRVGGEAFVASGTSWSPAFTFSPVTGALQSTDTGNGSIPCSALSLRGLQETILVRVRFPNIISGGTISLYDGEQGVGRAVESNLEAMQWSRIISLGYDDRLGLTASVAAGGIAADIDVVHSLPGEHLSRRWEAAL